jgi:hypothetical protein
MRARGFWVVGAGEESEERSLPAAGRLRSAQDDGVKAKAEAKSTTEAKTKANTEATSKAPA